MATSEQTLPRIHAVAPIVAQGEWYALHTRPRHEKMVVERLAERGVQTYLPMFTEVHRWSDRKK